MPMGKLIKLNERFIYPDATFFLKVRPEECLRRINKRGDGIKFFEKFEKLKKVLKNYQKAVKLFDDVIVIDGEKTIKQISKKITTALNRKRNHG